MRFGLSEGMVLAAADDQGIYLLEPDSGAKPGQELPSGGENSAHWTKSFTSGVKE